MHKGSWTRFLCVLTGSEEKHLVGARSTSAVDRRKPELLASHLVAGRSLVSQPFSCVGSLCAQQRLARCRHLTRSQASQGLQTSCRGLSLFPSACGSVNKSTTVHVEKLPSEGRP